MILAFIIPLSLAALLFAFGHFFVSSPCANYSVEPDAPKDYTVEFATLAAEEYWFFGGRPDSFGDPYAHFVTMRNYQNCQNETESPSIFG